MQSCQCIRRLARHMRCTARARVSLGDAHASNHHAYAPGTEGPSPNRLEGYHFAPTPTMPTLPRPHAPPPAWHQVAASGRTNDTRARGLLSPIPTRCVCQTKLQCPCPPGRVTRTSQPLSGAYSSLTRITTLLAPAPGACAADMAWSVHRVSIRSDPKCHRRYCSACSCFLGQILNQMHIRCSCERTGSSDASSLRSTNNRRKALCKVQGARTRRVNMHSARPHDALFAISRRTL